MANMNPTLNAQLKFPSPKPFVRESDGILEVPYIIKAPVPSSKTLFITKSFHIFALSASKPKIVPVTRATKLAIRIRFPKKSPPDGDG